MNILAIDPYYGGSHKAFLEGWSSHSKHEFRIVGLRPYKWKWRMRHAAVTAVESVRRLQRQASDFDVIFCTDMLNLAEFRGLLDTVDTSLPTVVYFHENQLTYPVQMEKERDLHFGFTNLTTALAADAVWFNSAYHRDDFLGALRGFCSHLPDFRPADTIPGIRNKSEIHHPGVSSSVITSTASEDGPLRIVWVGRWEHDKNPGDFFAALLRLKDASIPFELAVLGEGFTDVPACFEQSRGPLSESTVQWGYLEDRREFEERLDSADVVVSTANHEFFGIAIMEAAVHGCCPVLPDRLVYPELFGREPADAKLYLYDGSRKGLVNRLTELARRKQAGDHLEVEKQRAKEIASGFLWESVARKLDSAIERVAAEVQNHRRSNKR